MDNIDDDPKDPVPLKAMAQPVAGWHQCNLADILGPVINTHSEIFDGPGSLSASPQRSTQPETAEEAEENSCEDSSMSNQVDEETPLLQRLVCAKSNINADRLVAHVLAWTTLYSHAITCEQDVPSLCKGIIFEDNTLSSRIQQRSPLEIFHVFSETLMPRQTAWVAKDMGFTICRKLGRGGFDTPPFDRGTEVYHGERSGSELATSQRWGQLRTPRVRALNIQSMEKTVSTF
ncbi:hypothetical protein C8R48DRAFT_672282 [Suillus tomentosus]|nr:hypothetical protein C8R48DRAFT_672282 [Suillus tomentosus]